MARALIRTALDAALGTLSADGAPSVSHVAIATLTDGSPVTMVSDLSLHTKNLKRDDRASLLFVAPHGETGDTNTRARLSLIGRMEEVADRDAARTRILRRHPDAFYVDFPDFHLMKLVPASAHLVAGFGRVTDIPTAALLSPADLSADLAPMDGSACEHMNDDHLDALALMAERLAGAGPGDWRAIGIDPQGIDLAADGRVTRVEFDAPVGDGGALRVALKRLGDRARASGQGAPDIATGA